MLSFNKRRKWLKRKASNLVKHDSGNWYTSDQTQYSRFCQWSNDSRIIPYKQHTSSEYDIYNKGENFASYMCVTKNATIHTSQNACLHQNNLGKSIFSVTLSSVTFLQIAELEEMCRPVILMVVLPRCAQFHSISHTYSMLHPHEIIVPRTIIRYLLKQKNKKTKNKNQKRNISNNEKWCYYTITRCDNC